MFLGTSSDGMQEEAELIGSRRGKGRSGFTLIELLVVIAIIAILAAILFPVFARAKASAKTSASLSNAKQNGIAILMYTTDYDDTLVITGQWHSSDPDAYQRYPTSPYMPWTGLIELYAKNRDILQTPVTGKTNFFVGPGSNQCSRVRECDLLYPTYGYNPYLSPSTSSSLPSGLSATAVNKPAEQIMLTEIWSRNNTTFGSFASGADVAYISLATAEPPDGASSPKAANTPFARVSWGKYSPTTNAELVRIEEGMYRGGVAFRHTNRTPTVFLDGHAKLLPAETLARGTDWVSGVTMKAINLQDGTYMWDPTGN